MKPCPSCGDAWRTGETGPCCKDCCPWCRDLRAQHLRALLDKVLIAALAVLCLAGCVFRCWWDKP